MINYDAIHYHLVKHVFHITHLQRPNTPAGFHSSLGPESTASFYGCTLVQTSEVFLIDKVYSMAWERMKNASYWFLMTSF